MVKAIEHYRAAEDCLNEADHYEGQCAEDNQGHNPLIDKIIARAQVHATLAAAGFSLVSKGYKHLPRELQDLLYVSKEEEW